MFARQWIAACATMLLGGCGALTAEAPLFNPGDLAGPAPLVEGVWIEVNERCPEQNVHRNGRLPQDCHLVELRREADGSWTFNPQESSGSDDSSQKLRFVVAPATERNPDNSYVPLYLAEYEETHDTNETKVRYAVIIPVGTLPAEEMYLVPQIGCAEILRDGPIEGITETHDENGDSTGCIATSQAAVREAARRSLIENLGELLDEEPSAHLRLVRR